MTPLTPEQVAKLRLPSWFQLVPISEYQGDLTFEVLCKDKWQGQITEEGKESSFGAPRSEVILAYLAENIANGYLPPEALDAVWAVVEGKPSREAELLRAVTETHTAAVKASAAARAARCDDMEWAQRDADEQEAGEEFRSAMAAACKWIEEQKP